MNTKLRPPCWVKIIATGDVLMCRRISIANRRMKAEQGWVGLVCHVQNEKGTGLVEYRKCGKPTAEDLEKKNTDIKRRFGV